MRKKIEILLDGFRYYENWQAEYSGISILKPEVLEVLKTIDQVKEYLIAEVPKNACSCCDSDVNMIALIKESFE